jgi:hypothetical protein
MMWYIAGGVVIGAIIMGLLDRWLIYSDEVEYMKQHKGKVLVDPIELANMRESIAKLNNDELWASYLNLIRKAKQ